MFENLFYRIVWFKSFDAVTILFCELVGLSSSTVQETMDMVTTMNEIFSCFDSLMDEYKVYKVNDYQLSLNSALLFFCNFSF